MKLSFHLAFLILLLSFLFHSSFAILLRRISKQPSSPLYVQPTTFSFHQLKQYENPCLHKQCSQNAVCKLDEASRCPYCACKSGYVFNGLTCTVDTCPTCNDPFGKCYDTATGTCKCKAGTKEVNGICVDCDDEIHNPCNPKATCTPTGNGQPKKCICKPGLYGDGINCFEIRECLKFNYCHKYASCEQNPDEGQLDVCRCFPNFVGNGKLCCPNLRISPDIVTIDNSGKAKLRLEIPFVPTFNAKYCLSGINLQFSECEVEFSAGNLVKEITVAYERSALEPGRLDIQYCGSNNEFKDCPVITKQINKGDYYKTSPNCQILYDPYYSMFDDRSMTHSLPGVYILTRSDDTDFVVEATTNYDRSNSATLVEAVAIKYKDSLVFINLGSCYRTGAPLGTLTTNFRTSDRECKYSVDGYKITTKLFPTLNGQMRININELSVPLSQYGKTKGLCGDFGPPTQGLFRARPPPDKNNGILVSNVDVFAASWLVEDRENLFSYGINANFRQFGVMDMGAMKSCSAIPPTQPTSNTVLPLPNPPRTDFRSYPFPAHRWANQAFKTKTYLICGGIIDGPLHDACVSAGVSEKAIESMYSMCLEDTRSSENIDFAFRTLEAVSDNCKLHFQNNPELFVYRQENANTEIPALKILTTDCPFSCHAIKGTKCSTSCECTAGVTTNSFCQTLVQDNVCLRENGKCEEGYECEINREGNIICETCQEGYKKLNGRCVVKDECASEVCGKPQDGVTCLSEKGIKSCICLPGFIYSESEKKCLDINECEIFYGGCHPNARCINTLGSRECVCKPGFSGNGLTCTDIDECADTITRGRCPANSYCVNRIGYRDCICNQGKKANYLLFNALETATPQPKYFNYIGSMISCT